MKGVQQREGGLRRQLMLLLLDASGGQRQSFEQSHQMPVSTDTVHQQETGLFVLDVVACTVLHASLLAFLDSRGEVLLLSNASRRLQLACLTINSPDSQTLVRFACHHADSPYHACRDHVIICYIHSPSHHILSTVLLCTYLAIPYSTPRPGFCFARRFARRHGLGFARGERLLGIRQSTRAAHTLMRRPGAHRLPGLRNASPTRWRLLCHFGR